MSYRHRPRLPVRGTGDLSSAAAAVTAGIRRRTGWSAAESGERVGRGDTRFPGKSERNLIIILKRSLSLRERNAVAKKNFRRMFSICVCEITRVSRPSLLELGFCEIYKTRKRSVDRYGRGVVAVGVRVRLRNS